MLRGVVATEYDLVVGGRVVLGYVVAADDDLPALLRLLPYAEC